VRKEHLAVFMGTEIADEMVMPLEIKRKRKGENK
jgi:hypothetical protein